MVTVTSIAQESVPFTHSLRDIYDEESRSSQTNRYQFIQSKFIEKFGIQPTFYTRSPGRVNLIGEHIDYAGFSVLPMALDRDVVVAIAITENKTDDYNPSSTSSNNMSTIKVSNTKSSKYADFVIHHEHGKNEVEIDSSILFWGNYFKGPYQAVMKHFDIKYPVSFAVMIDGSVPAGAGVSSSAAFVCASTLAIIKANQLNVDKGTLASLAIQGERLTGVQYGGMDQSISVMGVRDSALLIHFHPKLFAECTPIPVQGIPVEDYVFVVANTLVVADKHETAPSNYNLRVVETRFAAAVLAKFLELDDYVYTATGSTPQWRTLKIVADQEAQKLVDSGRLSSEIIQDPIQILQVMMDHVERVFQSEPYSKEEIADLLGMTVQELHDQFIGSIVIKPQDGKFRLYQRAKHVYSEACRVFQFRNATQGKAPYSGKVLEDLGQLMNQSQDSCRDLFNCSCQELDELTEICRKSGAVGSRLTGAGWGGCTVSLVKTADLKRFLDNVKKEYYEKKNLIKDIQNFDEVVFYCKPGSGSFVYSN